MGTRNVVITDQQDAFLQALVAAGRFQNVSEALRAGLRLLEQEEGQTVDIRRRLNSGLAQAQRGERSRGTGEDAVRRAFAKARERSRR